MKVAHILGSLNRGGVETLLLNIITLNEQSQLDFSLFYRHDGDLSQDFHNTKKNIIKLPDTGVWGSIRYLENLRRILTSKKIDIVHTHQRIDTVYAKIAAIGTSVKIFQTIHDFDLNYSIFNRFLSIISFKLAHKNIFVSVYQENYYKAKYPHILKNSAQVIYNGINLHDSINNATQPIRKEFGINDKSQLLGMVGNFNEVRDQMTICRFLYLLSRKGIDFKFLFIGKMENNKQNYLNDCISYCMKNGIYDRVIFTGSRSDVQLLLPQLDAFIYSSEHDTFGIAVVEAIASGIPVFVNDWGAMKEITLFGNRAVLYRSKDENNLLEEFLKYFHNPESYRKQARLNSEWAKKTYSINYHIQELQNIYNTI